MFERWGGEGPGIHFSVPDLATRDKEVNTGEP